MVTIMKHVVTIIMDNDDNYNGKWWQLQWKMVAIIMDNDDNGGNHNGKWWQL